MAAVLACGDGAVVSHLSSAAVSGFAPPTADVVHITVRGRRCRPKSGIHVHRAATLDPRDVTTHQNVPITTPARALVEIAASLPLRDVERVFDEALVKRIVTRSAVRNAQRRASRRRGSKIINTITSAEGGTRSEAERHFRTLIRKSGLPRPAVNVRLGPYEVDFLWSEQRLIVEVDGYAFHSSRTAFERDRRRDAHLQSLGYRVMRVTWRQLMTEPEAVLVRITQALAHRAT
jgi:very-short-patch-repair endonuclease